MKISRQAAVVGLPLPLARPTPTPSPSDGYSWAKFKFTPLLGGDTFEFCCISISKPSTTWVERAAVAREPAGRWSWARFEGSQIQFNSCYSTAAPTTIQLAGATTAGVRARLLPARGWWCCSRLNRRQRRPISCTATISTGSSAAAGYLSSQPSDDTGELCALSTGGHAGTNNDKDEHDDRSPAEREGPRLWPVAGLADVALQLTFCRRLSPKPDDESPERSLGEAGPSLAPGLVWPGHRKVSSKGHIAGRARSLVVGGGGASLAFVYCESIYSEQLITSHARQPPDNPNATVRHDAPRPSPLFISKPMAGPGYDREARAIQRAAPY